VTAKRPQHGKRDFGVLPAAVMMLSTLFFVLPLLAMARFSFQNVPMINLGIDTLLSEWSASGVTKAFSDAEFRTSLLLSAKLAAGTVVLTLALIIPTTLWVHIRLPKAKAFVEFLTLLPYVIPSIALVAGILPLKPYARWFLNSPYSLIPFYAVLALPFTYRSLDAGINALDVRTLVDASRSLGAGWLTTLLRVIIPNITTAMVSASFLTAAVVLGEYTMARVLLKPTFSAFMEQYQDREPQGGMGLALASLVLTTALFAILSRLTRPKHAATRKTRTRRTPAPREELFA
jgi:putative spermidine/putrescine transport system permease protein